MAKRYDDDYEGSSFEKFTHRKSKNHRKGHQSRFNDRNARWDQAISDVEDETPYTPVVEVVSVPSSALPKVEHQFGANTHDIKGVKIDFDGVSDIQKVENTKNNVTTYGIKFFFKGKKGLYRIIWYNTNMRARDAAYNTEYGFWLTINK